MLQLTCDGLQIVINDYVTGYMRSLQVVDHVTGYLGRLQVVINDHVTGNLWSFASCHQRSCYM